ncbi:MAG: hypothetical protein V7713_19795 [Marinobacter sp.]
MGVHDFMVARTDIVTVEQVIAEAQKERSDGIAPLMIAADRLAVKTVKLINDMNDPAILASVALSITDQPFKVAYLERIGAALIAGTNRHWPNWPN